MPNGLEVVPTVLPCQDAELAARVARGDRDAEALLVERYTRPVLAVLQRRLQQPDLAHDLAHETFIIAFERLRGEGIDEPDRLSGFLRRTAINLAIGEQRKTTRRRTDSNSGTRLDDIVDDATGPFGRLALAELRKLVRHLIHSLPTERDRDLLWRYYVQEEDKETLCGAFNLSVEHFDRVLHRARGRLRELVEKKTDLAENRHAPPR
jgi:RNA polymerase sigma factor (sigma-70 family)